MSSSFPFSIQEKTMTNFVQRFALVTVLAVASLWSAGCSSSVTGTDKMGMSSEKMATDKMGMEKMSTDKMGTDGMENDKMSDAK
jgi:pentapeptide MXKDX repeat protein